MLAALLAGGLGAFVLARSALFTPAPAAPKVARKRPRLSLMPRQLIADRLSVWWDVLPDEVEARVARSARESNIHPQDYAGPDSCRRCHPVQHQSWSSHPHRWMNALAEPATALGDFSRGAGIDYRGGRATFLRTGDRFVMTLERDGVRRTYAITQTIGRRFYQYYVGKLTHGPEPAGHPFYTRDHVLPFGYWLAGKEWAPIVHVGPERADAERPDPFAPPESGPHYADYAASCNYCHTTFPLGDLLTRRPQQMGRHVPFRLHWSLRDYLDAARPAAAEGIDELPEGKRGKALDDLCLKCHGKYRPAETRQKHTHHPAGSAGERCMDCHMPRINEGIQDVVRTHMIYSPTRADMIEANHPNACNLCHTDRPIDWTLKHLKEWYGWRYDEDKLASAYPHRTAPAAVGWMKSDNEAVRLVAAEAVCRARDETALPHVLDALDDPYLLNRQFAAKGLQQWLKVRLSEDGYRFYHSSDERRKPIEALRKRLLPKR